MISRSRRTSATARPREGWPVMGVMISTMAPSWTPIPAGMKNAPARASSTTASMHQASATETGWPKNHKMR